MPGLLIAIYFLPRSEALLFDAWKTSFGVKERGFVYEKLFGIAPIRYDIDVQGRVIALYIRDQYLRSIEELPGIEKFTSLRHLEISDSPVERTIDVSSFIELDELILKNTRLTHIVGLDKLTRLNRLDLEGSPIEAIDASGSVQKFNLSSTKVTDLSSLALLQQIKELTLEEMDLSQVRGLESLPPIDLISFRRCTHVPLERLGRVKILILDGSDVTDLSPLSRSKELTVLSIFDTRVESLKGLENSSVLAINSNNPDFTADFVRDFFNRDVALWRVNFNALSVSTLVPEPVWYTGSIISIILVVTGVFALLPLPFVWRTPPLLKLKRITRFMIPGAFMVLAPWMIANLDLPFNAGPEDRFGLGHVMKVHAALIACSWLILIPLLLVLLDTKALRQHVISAPATMFSWLFMWWGRPLLIVSPLFVLIGYSLWQEEKPSPANGIFAILLVIPFFLLPLSFVLIGTALYWKGRRDPGSVIRKLLFPSIGAGLSVAFGCLTIVYLAIVPDNLSRVPGRSVVVMGSAFVFLVLLFIGLQMFEAGVRGRAKRREMHAVLSGTGPNLVTIEVPFRQNYFELPFFGELTTVWKIIFSPAAERDLNVLTTDDVGQATSVQPGSQVWRTLGGIVVIIQRNDLIRAKEWEFTTLRDWIFDIYGKSWSPIWIAGDWIGEVLPENASIKRKIDTLELLSPFVSGLENASVPSGSIFGMKPPDNIIDCLEANQMVECESLELLGFPELLQNAPTPLARMLRGVFSQSHLANRLDMTVRCVETAIAMMSLIFVSDYKLEQRQDRSIDKAISILLQQPTFKSWTSLFDTFAKNSDNAFVQFVVKGINKPSISESYELREMVKTIGGEDAVRSVASKIRTTRDTLSLLIAFRNVITAHGPAIERAAPELYRAVFLVAIDLLASLQWQSCVFYTVLPNRGEIYFRDRLPEINGNVAHDDRMTNVFVNLLTSDKSRKVDVSRFFRIEEITLSLAVYAEENRFVEPVSGLNVDLSATTTG